MGTPKAQPQAATKAKSYRSLLKDIADGKVVLAGRKANRVTAICYMAMIESNEEMKKE